MNLVLLEAEEVAAEGRVTLTGRRAAHLLAVLGVTAGARVRVGRVRGPTGSGEVVATTADSVTLALTLEDRAPAPPTVAVVLALPRPKALPRLLAAVASMGVERIDLTNAWRVDKSYFDSPRVAPEALAEAVRLGCEQGSSTWVPEVRVHRRFTELLADLEARPMSRRLVAHPRAPQLLEQVVTNPERGPVVLALGPDGGFIEGELTALADHGFVPIRLGPWVLRTELAAPVALAQLALLERLAAPHGGGFPRPAAGRD